MICSFIGHRDAPDSIHSILHQTLCALIERERVDCFYVGEQGAFDRLVLLELRELQKRYPYIQYCVVLAYYDPIGRQNPSIKEKTLYPWGLERVPRRYAISRRNRWMIEQSSFLVAYVNSEIGNSASVLRMAYKRGVQIINLAK